MNKCFKQKLTVLPEKSVSWKKYAQKRPILCARIWVTWLWKAIDAKPLTPGRVLGYFWLIWGVTVQTRCVRSVASKLNPSNFFLFCAEIGEKWIFRVRTGQFFGAIIQGIFKRTQDSEKSIWFVLLSLHFEVIAAQNETIGSKLVA